MVYLVHCLQQASLDPPSAVHILRTSDEPWLYRDLRAEITGLFPAAEVREVDVEAPPAECDLLIVPLVQPFRFPMQDVVYDELGELGRLSPRLRAARHLLLYRARWREAEALSSKRWRRYLLQKRLEAVLIRLLRRFPLLRLLVGPLPPAR